MPNLLIKQITLPSGNTYDIVDEGARDLIAELLNYTRYLGVTTTPLEDGDTTNPIMINGESVTALNGDVTTYDHDEFIFNGTIWQKFGSLSGLGSLAYKDTASGSGTVAVPSTFTSTFVGGSDSVSVTGTTAGSVSVTKSNVTISKANSGTSTYTPEGSVSAPTISVDTAGTTDTITEVTDVGSMPSYSVSNEVLIITGGVVPTTSNVTVKTGDATYTASAPTFTGTGARLVTDSEVATDASFTGDTITSTGTVSPSGTVTTTVASTTTETVNVTVS